MDMVTLAEQIAREAHAGQQEKGGGDYIAHVERVVAKVTTPDEKAVAWLHDVVEDTTITEVELVRRGVPGHIVVAVVILTRGTEPYAEYIANVGQSQNRLAIAIKVADLRDHLEHFPTEVLNESMIKRYQRAIDLLTYMADVDAV